jgi:hypothetical protein
MKIVPSEAFHALPSRSAKKKVRKNIRGMIEKFFMHPTSQHCPIIVTSAKTGEAWLSNEREDFTWR